MLIDLATYRTLTGDTISADADATAAIVRTQTLVEGYTARRLELTEHSESRRLSAIGNLFHTREWPLVSLTSVTDTAGNALDLTDITIDTDTGAIEHNARWAGQRLTLVYQAGYATAPPDLALAMSQIAHNILTGATDTRAANPVKREVVFGVASVDYALPNVAECYPELGQYRVMLDRYRRAEVLP